MAIHLKEKPFFIIGSERSGTTLLMAMLGEHPRLAVPEVAWLYPRFRPYLYSYGNPLTKEMLRTLAEEMIFGLKTPFWGMKVNPASIVDEIFSELKEDSFAGIYCAMFERYAKEMSKPRWGEKTPHNLFFISDILEDFPNAQFIFVQRDGRDSSAEYLESAFGPTHIFCAAEIWKRCQNAVKPWRNRLSSQQWLDVKYEELVKEPERILKSVCNFLGEEYTTRLFDFFKSPTARRRGQTKDHAPLGGPVSTNYIGVYKLLLSVKQQQIFMAVAGDELREAGYEIDVEPAALTPGDIARFKETDGRVRAALLDAADGHIVFESYNDWLFDKREERRQQGIWTEKDIPTRFPLGDPLEEEIAGYRAHRRWKQYLCIKRQYLASHIVL